MKFFSTFLFFLSFFQMLDAQSSPERAVVPFGPHTLSQAFLGENEKGTMPGPGATANVPLENTGPFLAYSIVWYSVEWDETSGPFSIVFSLKNTGQHLQQISPDHHAVPQGGRYVSELYFLENDAQTFQLTYNGGAKIDSIAVHFYNPGHAGTTPTVPSNIQPSPSPGQQDRSACTCPQPAYEGRADWCPAGNCPPSPSPAPTAVGHLIVHHSAGISVSSNWAAVVRAIWDFHVNVNGWADIGYNWLIDPNGVLYEGRGDNVIGAHFCATNAGTMGVCVLGDFTNMAPTSSALGMLEELLAWKVCDADLEPLGAGLHASSGLTLNRISGHRDGCATSCPGDAFYPLLPGVRQNVSDFIDNGCEVLPVDAPTQLTATLVAFNLVELGWQDNSDSETGYELERSMSFNTNYQVIAALPANTIGYLDLDVQPVTGYFYRVKAVHGNTPSPYSNEVYIATGVTATDDLGRGEKSIVISPNPSSGVFMVSIDNQWFGKMGVSVFDAMGRQVTPVSFFEKGAAAFQLEMDLQGLPAGVFFVKYQMGGKAIFKKVLKNG